MAKKKFSLDFKGFLDIAEEIDKLGEGVLMEATIKALDESRKYVNIEVGKAMKKSKYSFSNGIKYSQGRARKSLIEVSKLPVEVIGTVVKAYAGVDMKEAPEVVILAVEGAPHEKPDLQLRHAIKVKGAIRKNVDIIQTKVFNEALRKGLNNG